MMEQILHRVLVITERQNRTLDALIIASSTISVFSSMVLLYLILRVDKPKRKRETSQGASISTPMDPDLRFLTCIATVDIASSVRLAFSPMISPTEPSPVCSFAVVALLWTFATPVYNAILTLYFCLLIRYKVSPRKFARWFEPFGHVVALGFPLCSIVTGLVDQGFNPIGGRGCGWAGWPPRCEQSDVPYTCTRGVNAQKQSRLYYAMIGVATLGTMLICTMLTVHHVWKIEQRASRWRLNASDNRQSRLRKTRQVAIQGSLYVLSLLASQMPLIVIVIYGLEESSYSRFGQQIAYCALFPLQGLFNLLVYIRPRYAEYRSVPMSRSTLANHTGDLRASRNYRNGEQALEPPIVATGSVKASSEGFGGRLAKSAHNDSQQPTCVNPTSSSLSSLGNPRGGNRAHESFT